jgi:uncharacterized protein YndB with AHSA1/START domain
VTSGAGSSVAAMTGYVAKAEKDVAAPAEEVWGLLTTQASRVYFGSEVESDWKVGSSVVWRGEWEGKPFEDRGEVVEADAPTRLVITHYSPLSGEEDSPENYHRMEYTLTDIGGGTHVVLEQDGNPSQESADHAAANWQQMLDGLADIAAQG